jgi:SAM-dependent methyltransferase
MTNVDTESVRAAVRETYGRIASGQRTSGCCGPVPSSAGAVSGCCGTAAPVDSSAIGYSEAEQQSAPEGADLGLGCGNPQTIASLQPGERVLDLGAGAGFDAFLAARQVGPTGQVIGVDMTPEMVARARGNVSRTDLHNVDFRLGEIEHLPVPDSSVDVVMSNCVINLSTDKPAVFREAYRVLAPGGRLAISDIIALRELPPAVRNDLTAYTGCVSGAALTTEVEGMLRDAGFVDVQVEVKGSVVASDAAPGAEPLVASALIRGTRPRTTARSR